jgi:molecular chaperone GrpE (heat shock protein)
MKKAMDKEKIDETTLPTDTIIQDTIYSDETESIRSKPDKSISAEEDNEEKLFINPEILRSAVSTKALISTDAARMEESLENNTKLVEEVAEDMLEVTRRLKHIETQQSLVLEHLTALENKIQEHSMTTAREVAALRGVVSGEQKGALTRGAFNAVVTSLDFVRSMKKGLENEVDVRMIRQFEAIELSLESAIQGLGFLEIEVAPQDLFDPGRMECLGYEPGKSGLVTSFVRPGYAIGNIVIRPAGVLIANPDTENETKEETGNGQRNE